MDKKEFKERLDKDARNYREGILKGLWEAEHIIMDKIRKMESDMSKDFPGSMGEDPGY